MVAPTVDFLPFAAGSGANVITQAQYAALAAQTQGFASGLANSAQLNKVWRQSALMTAALANLIALASNQNVYDSGNVQTLMQQIAQGLATYDYGTDNGTVNVYQVAHQVPVLALVDGLQTRFKAGYSNTGRSTLAVDATTVAPIYNLYGGQLTGGEIIQNRVVTVVWNSTANGWILQNSATVGAPIGGSVQIVDGVTIGATSTTLATFTAPAAGYISVTHCVGAQAISNLSANTIGALVASIRQNGTIVANSDTSFYITAGNTLAVANSVTHSWIPVAQGDVITATANVGLNGDATTVWKTISPPGTTTANSLNYHYIK